MRITDWELSIGEMTCAIIVKELPVPCYAIRQNLEEKYKACFIEDEEEPFTIKYHTKSPGFAEAIEARLIIDGGMVSTQITPLNHTIVRDARVPPTEQGFKFRLFGFPGQGEYEAKVRDECFGLIILELRHARISARPGKGVHTSDSGNTYEVNKKPDYTFQFLYRPTQYLVDRGVIYSTPEDDHWWAEDPNKKSGNSEGLEDFDDPSDPGHLSKPVELYVYDER